MPLPKISTPLFSVILPTYNRSALLKKAIFSIINQEFKNWELIIIDDGSSDDTQQIVGPILKKHNNIFYFWQKNQGRGNVRNIGIEKTRGSYITFLDDDDYWLSDHLLVFWHKLKKVPTETIIKSEGYLEQSFKLSPLTTYNHDSIKNVITNIWQIGAHLSSFCFPKSVFHKFRFNPTLYFAQDYHLIMRLVLHYNLTFTNKRTFVIVDHPNRGTYKIDETTFEHLYHSRITINRYFVEHEKQKLLKYMNGDKIKIRTSYDYLYLANYAARLSKYQLMLKLVLQAILLFKMGPKSLKKLLAVFYQATASILQNITSLRS